MEEHSTHIEKTGKITISDVAEALGVSKTTVSRAISGKGRIGEATRNKVLQYISEHDYHPSSIAKGLAQSRTYNIGWVMPGDYTVTDLPFFQRCMMGISEIAAQNDYDVLITLVFDKDISHLHRIVEQHKVDGIILGRTLVKDDRIEFLKTSDVPFVVVGSCTYDDVVQIDNDHIHACRELTSILLMKGIKKPALIGGDSNHVVNRTRRQGYTDAMVSHNMPDYEELIYMNADTTDDINRAVDDALKNGADCIISMDDRICTGVLDKLRKEDISIPADIKLASFYSSPILVNNQPAITSLQYDPKELGAESCRTLFDIIDGIETEQRKLLGYEVVLKGSTQ